MWWESLIWVIVGCAVGAVGHLFRWYRSRYSMKIEQRTMRVYRRVQLLDSGSLPNWADQALSELGQTFSMYRRTGEDVYLDDCILGAETLGAVFREMKTRRG